MHLVLNPLAAVAWRAPDRVQIGLDPDTGFILDGVSPAQERLLEALIRGVDDRALRRLGARHGLARPAVDEFVSLLTERGAVLTQAPDGCTQLTCVAAGQRTEDGRDLWQRVLQRRQATVLVIGGGSPAGLELIGLLLGEGVGGIVVDDDSPVTSADITTGWYAHADLGRPRAQAFTGRHPAVRTGSVRDGLRPDLTVVLADWAVSPRHYEPLLREDLPHLAVVVREHTALVGPYVLPGRTGCLRCHDMYRADRDPDWVTVLAQVGELRRRGRPGLLQRLALTTACAEALTALDGGYPTTYGSTLELSVTQPVPTVRAWPAHTRCGCTWELLTAPVLTPPLLRDAGQ